MKIIALDLSTNTGFSILKDSKVIEYGNIQYKVEDFNVQNYPEKSPKYPYNIVESAENIAMDILSLVESYDADFIVIENTVKGRNRNTQRILEFIHMAVLMALKSHKSKIKYLDPSEWRKIMDVRLSKADKDHNKMVGLKVR